MQTGIIPGIFFAESSQRGQFMRNTPSIKYFSMATALFMQKISGQSTGRNPVRRLAANSTVLPVFVFIMLMSRNISHSAQINQRK